VDVTDNIKQSGLRRYEINYGCRKFRMLAKMAASLKNWLKSIFNLM